MPEGTLEQKSMRSGVNCGRRQQWRLIIAPTRYFCFDSVCMKIDAAAEILECNLELVGVTGVEDRLQDKVPETIKGLLEVLF